MLKLTGVQIGQYDTNYTNKDTGEVVHKKRIQVMTTQKLKDGEKSVLHDLTVPPEKAHKYKGMDGKEVTIDVSYFGKDITFFGI